MSSFMCTRVIALHNCCRKQLSHRSGRVPTSLSNCGFKCFGPTRMAVMEPGVRVSNTTSTRQYDLKSSEARVTPFKDNDVLCVVCGNGGWLVGVLGCLIGKIFGWICTPSMEWCISSVCVDFVERDELGRKETQDLLSRFLPIGRRYAFWSS